MFICIISSLWGLGRGMKLCLTVLELSQDLFESVCLREAECLRHPWLGELLISASWSGLNASGPLSKQSLQSSFLSPNWLLTLESPTLLWSEKCYVCSYNKQAWANAPGK